MAIAVLDDAPSAVPTAGPSAADERDLGPRWLPPLVLLAAIGGSVGIFVWFCGHSRELWWWMGHDRHTHYLYGLNLAMDVRTMDWARLFHDFDRMRVWGPVHPVLVGVLQFFAGPDHRLAVVPSLAGWALTVWCAFLIPRRLLSSGGNAAGLLAALLVAVSPAHRAFATDCMYESLGAGLTLAVLCLYLATLQDGTRRAALGLGLSLTVLFLHKYNYWLLVSFGLVIGEFARQPRAWLGFGRSLCQRERLPAWMIAELKQPLNWIALALAAAALYVGKTGGGTVTLGRWSLSFQEPHNLVHAAYIAFFLRVALWWHRTGRAWSLQWPGTLRTVALWHGVPVAVWFLLPKRLSYFLWFLSPANSDQVRESVPLMHGLPYYLQALRDDYLPLSWGVYLFLAMLGLGVLQAWRLKPGSAALFAFFAVATYLTCQHPMLKNRFVHSWIAAGWVIGAVGLIATVQQIAGALSLGLRISPSPLGTPGGEGWGEGGERPARGLDDSASRRPLTPAPLPRSTEGEGRTAARWSAAAACVILIGLHAPVLFEPGHAQEGGPKAELPSPLRITDTYLPALADAKNPTIISNVSARFLWSWTFIEQHRHQNFAAEIKNFKSYEGNPEQVRRWLETTRSDVLVLIDIRPGSTFDWKTDEYVDLSAFKQVLADQSAWTLSERWQMPEGVTITVWTKQ